MEESFNFVPSPNRFIISRAIGSERIILSLDKIFGAIVWNELTKLIPSSKGYFVKASRTSWNWKKIYKFLVFIHHNQLTNSYPFGSAKQGNLCIYSEVEILVCSIRCLSSEVCFQASINKLRSTESEFWMTSIESTISGFISIATVSSKDICADFRLARETMPTSARDFRKLLKHENNFPTGELPLKAGVKYVPVASVVKISQISLARCSKSRFSSLKKNNF